MFQLSFGVTALAILISTTAFAGVEIVQKVENTGPAPMAMDMTVRVEGSRARVDVGTEMSTITGPTEGDFTTLMHSQKMAMRLPAGAITAMKEQMKPGGETDVVPKIEPTGRTEEISGYHCEEYKGTVGEMEATYWVTKDLPNQEAVLDQLSRIAGDMDPFKGALKDGALPGFPIRTEVISPRTGKSVVTVQSITEKDIPAETFDIPADYRAAAIPNIPGN